MFEIETIRNIYAKLGDEQSKKIFNCRLLYSLTGNSALMEPMIAHVRNKVFEDKVFQKLYERLNGVDGHKYIFGRGVYGKQLYYLMPKVEWTGFIDNSATEGDMQFDLPVIRPSDIADTKNAIIVISSYAFKEEMENQMAELGIPRENVVDGTIVYELTEGKQYFDLEYIDYANLTTFLDGGSYDGMTALQFTKISSKANKVWCFEADSRNIFKIEQRFVNMNSTVDYEIIKKGIWNKTTTLVFVGNGSGESFIAESLDKTYVDSEMIDVVSIDEMIGDNKVDMIKFDIEGSELKGLEGTRNLIHKQQPVLAVCVYHKPEDIIEIPKYILEIAGSYKLYLRHYSFAANETVLYALP